MAEAVFLEQGAYIAPLHRAVIGMGKDTVPAAAAQGYIIVLLIRVYQRLVTNLLETERPGLLQQNGTRLQTAGAAGAAEQ